MELVYRDRLLHAICFLITLSATAPFGWAQVPLNTINSAYQQDFNTLANTGTSNTLPTGFTFVESGSGANTTYAAGTGSDNAGNTYSFGASATVDRAFGGLRSTSVIPIIGASFVNNTSTTITSLSISYTGEQWRLGVVNRSDRLDFQYSTNATSLTSVTYTDVDALDFSTPSQTGTGAKDGNAVGNRTSITSTITNLSIPPGATFWLRYVDFDASGSDDGLAIDDFSLTPIGTAQNPTVNLSVSASSATENPAQTVTIFATASAPVTGNQTVTLTPTGSATNTADYFIGVLGDLTITIADGQTQGSTSFNVINDTDVEGPESATLTISSMSSGLTSGSVISQSIGIIDDDVTPPALSVDPSSLSFVTTQGTPSAEQSYVISATALTADVTVTAPADVEISQTSGSGFGSSLTLPSSTTSATVFVRLSAGAAVANPFSGTITNSSGSLIATIVLSGTINPANTAPTLANPIPPQSATVGQSFSYSIPPNTFSDAETPSSLTLSVAGLPADLSFAGGTISGTPSTTTGSPFSVTLTATDPGSLSVSTSFVITVSPAPVVVTPLALTLTASPDVLLTTGTTTLSATVSGGTTPYSYSFSGPGTISPSGNTASVSGLPSGVQTFSVRVADANSPTSQTITATVSVTVTQANTAPTVANPIPPQSATVGHSFSYSIPPNTFSDAETPSSLTLSVAGLPTDLSFAGGTISGTPSTTTGSPFSVTLTATDPGSLSVSTSFAITVSPAPVVVTPLALTLTASPDVLLTTGTTTLSATVSGGTTPYSYSFSGPGTISPSGNTASVSGLPSGVQTFTVLVADSTSPTSQTITATVSVTVTEANTAPTVANLIPPQSATAGQSFSYSIPPNTFSDAETPSSLTLSVAGLPTDLSFAGGTISGTPSTTTGSPFSVTLTATDPGSLSVSTSFAITVSPAPVVVTPLALTLTASPDRLLTTGTTTLSATVSGGTTPYSYSFSGPGTISPSGNSASVSGLPSGVQTFSVLVADATSPTSQTITATVSVTVTEANTAPTVANLIPPQSATVGQSFSYSIPANTFTDAQTPSSLTLSVAGLPADLSFTAGTITGTPSTTTGSPFSVTLTATDPENLTASTTFALIINPAPVVVTPLALTLTASPDRLLTTGTTTLSATVSGGTPPYSYSFSGPSTISPSGNSASVSGLSAGVQTFSVLVADANSPTSQTITATVSVTVTEANTAPTVANLILPQSATVGQSFSFSIPANTFTDAQTPNSLTLSVAGLPADLSFTAGTISGTPSTTTGSPFSVTVMATDPGSLSVNTTFALTINPAPVVVSEPFAITSVVTLNCTSVANRLNISFDPQYTGLNGQPVSFSVANEMLPTTSPGPYTLLLYPDNPTITLHASQGGTITKAIFVYTWLAACNGQTPTNTAPTVVNPIPPQSATVGQNFSYLIPANTFTDAETPNALLLSVTGLPAGLSFTAPATITGNPSSSVGSPVAVTVVVTDPGGLSASTTFALTIYPGETIIEPTAPFAITGVTTIDCTPVADRINVSFSPRYAGLNGQTITFQVLNELAPTANPAPYSLSLYADNPLITLQAVQDGVTTRFSYNWLAACNGQIPTNTAPTLANPIPPQSATLGQSFSYSIPPNTFTDAQTPNALLLSVSGLPAGLSFTAPATISGTPSTTVGSPFTVTVTATDPGNLSATTSFALTVSPAESTTSSAPFAITGVSTLSCAVVSAGERNVTFNPQYAGLNGQAISFSIVNELASTLAGGPYTLRLYTDNPVITLKASQGGSVGEASFSYNWLAACSNNGRVGAERQKPLQVRVLGNPVRNGQVSIEISGATDQSVLVNMTDATGKLIETRRVEKAGTVDIQRFEVGRQPAGMLLLRVATATQAQTVKVLKSE